MRPSGKIGQISQKHLSLFYESLWLGTLLNLTFSAVAFLRGRDGLWYISQYQVSCFEACRLTQPMMLLASQTLLANDPTSAQGKDKVLISILQKQMLFSGKIPLQQSVLHSESHLEPAAPRTLALEARLCLGWGSERCTWRVEAQRFCVSRNWGHTISSVTKEGTTRGIPDSHLESGLQFNFWKGTFTDGNFHTGDRDPQYKWNAVTLFALGFLL